MTKRFPHDKDILSKRWCVYLSKSFSYSMDYYITDILNAIGDDCEHCLLQDALRRGQQGRLSIRGNPSRLQVDGPPRTGTQGKRTLLLNTLLDNVVLPTDM